MTITLLSMQYEVNFRHHVGGGRGVGPVFRILDGKIIFEFFLDIGKGRRSMTAHLRKNSYFPIGDQKQVVSSYFLNSNSNRFCS